VQNALAAHNAEKGEIEGRRAKLAKLTEKAAETNQSTIIDRNWAVLNEGMKSRGEKLDRDKENLQFEHAKQDFKEQLDEISNRMKHLSDPADEAETIRQIKTADNIKSELNDMKKPLKNLEEKAESFNTDVKPLIRKRFAQKCQKIHFEKRTKIFFHRPFFPYF
jgi:archaellum component FlaC